MIPLRWRLTLWHAGLTAIGLLGLTVISYQVLSESLRAEVDRALIERANHVSDALAVIPNRPIEGVSQEATDEFRSPGIYVQILNAQGTVVAHSFNLGAQQLPIPDADLNRVMAGSSFYDSVEISGQRVRLYYQPIQREGVIVGATQVGQSLTGVDATLNRLRLIYLLGGLSLILFSLLGGWLLARLGLQPVTHVTQAARQIVRAEDLSRRVTYTGPVDEVGTLATTFNEMLDRLQRLFETQRRFLAEAAHELRTPLASLLGNLDLLTRFGDDTERRAGAEAALQRTGQHLGRLLDDLLLLAQAEAGWHLQLRPVALDDIFMEAYETMRLTAPAVTLRIETCEPVQVLGDPDRLLQVLVNLIDNAIKYSPSGATVTLGLWCSQHWAQVRVNDRGPGIPPEALPHIFEPFFRGRGGERISGAGLGLTLVQWIVGEHGGEVHLNSLPDQGTTAIVSIPEHAA